MIDCFQPSEAAQWWIWHIIMEYCGCVCNYYIVDAVYSVSVFEKPDCWLENAKKRVGICRPRHGMAAWPQRNCRRRWTQQTVWEEEMTANDHLEFLDELRLIPWAACRFSQSVLGVGGEVVAPPKGFRPTEYFLESSIKLNASLSMWRHISSWYCRHWSQLKLNMRWYFSWELVCPLLRYMFWW